MPEVTSKDGTKIAFDRAGDGPAIVFVDGAFAHRAINPGGAQLAALLSPRFTVLTYDRRGRGASGDAPTYAVEREVEDLDAVIAQSGGSAFVLGGSSGAVLALEGAARGLSIDKLAVYEPPFIVDDTRPPLPDDYLDRLESLVGEGRRGDAVELFMTAAVGLPAEFVGPMREDPSFAELEKVAHTLIYDAQLMGATMSGGPLPADRWSAASVPTLVIDGGASDTYVHNAADALASVVRLAERRTLDGQTHDVDAAALAPVLEEFFR